MLLNIIFTKYILLVYFVLLVRTLLSINNRGIKMVIIAHLHYTGYNYKMISIVFYLYCQFTNIVFYDINNKNISCNIYFCNSIILRPS